MGRTFGFRREQAINDVRRHVERLDRAGRFGRQDGDRENRRVVFDDLPAIDFSVGPECGSEDRCRIDVMIPIMVDYTGMERRLLEDLPLVIGSGIALDQVQPVIDFAARNKLIKSAFPAAELIDPSALRA